MKTNTPGEFVFLSPMVKIPVRLASKKNRSNPIGEL